MLWLPSIPFEGNRDHIPPGMSQARATIGG